MALERVLLAAPHFPPHKLGGVELATLRRARWLSDLGIAVQVACVETVERGAATTVAWDDDVIDGVRVRRFRLTTVPGDDLRMWFDAPALRTQFETLIAQVRPELVHLGSGYLLGAAPIHAASQFGIPTVVSLSDFWFLCPTIQLLRGDGSLCYGPEPLECTRCLRDGRRAFRLVDESAPRVMRAMWRTLQATPAIGGWLGLPQQLATLQARRTQLVAALNRCAAIIAFSRFSADLHIAHGVARDRIAMISPEPIDVAAFDPVEPCSRPTGEVHFGYLGQVAPVKGVETLVRAFLRLRPANPGATRAYLHIHGQENADPSYTSRLRRLAAASPNITFGGPYEHRRALNLAHAVDALVIPSLWHENVPTTIKEAFAAGRPVIATRVEGIAEAVRDEVDGLLFSRGDEADLARVMQRVIDDPDLLRRLAGAILPLSSYEAHKRELLELYGAVRANQSGVPA